MGTALLVVSPGDLVDALELSLRAAQRQSLGLPISVQVDLICDSLSVYHFGLGTPGWNVDVDFD